MERAPIATFFSSPRGRGVDYAINLYRNQLVINHGIDRRAFAKATIGETAPWLHELSIDVGNVDFFTDRGGMFSSASVLFVDQSDSANSFLARFPSKEAGRMTDFLQALVNLQTDLPNSVETSPGSRETVAASNGPLTDRGDLAGQIREFAILHAEGVLTDEEFVAAKRRLLD